MLKFYMFSYLERNNLKAKQQNLKNSVKDELTEITINNNKILGNSHVNLFMANYDLV